MQTLEYWIEMLFRRWVVALQAGLLALGLVVLGTLLLPPTYESNAKVLVESNRAQLLVSPGLMQDSPNDPSAMTSAVTEQDLNSEIELLGSPALIRQAISGLPQRAHSGALESVIEHLQSLISLPNAGYDAIHAVPEMTAREEWARKIEHHLSTSVIKRSNVIEVAFSSHDPQWSAEFLSRLLTRYLELHVRISNDPHAERFFETQKRLLEERLDRAEEKLRGAQLQTGISEVNVQQGALINQLYAAEAEYRKTTASLAATNEQIVNVEGQLAKIPKRMDKESKVVQNLALQQIKPQVLQLEAERAELLSRYQPTSARILEIDAKLAAARHILEHENHTEVQESTSDVNPTWTSLDSTLADARSHAASLKATQAMQTQQISALNQQLKSLASDGMEITRLQLDVDTNKQAYLSYVRKGEEARAADALNRSQILNVTVVEDPSVPLEPVFPKLTFNLMAGLILALLVGAGAAYWDESRDPRICSTTAISHITGLPTVAVFEDRL